IHPNSILTDNYALEFSRSEKAEQELDKIFQAGKRKFWAEHLLLYFDWQPVHQILREMGKLVEDKKEEEYLQAKKLLGIFRNKVRELENTSIKFQNELRRKAVIYFNQQFIDHFNVPLAFAFRIIASYSFMSSEMSIVPRRFSDLSLSLSNLRHTAPSKTGMLLIGIAISVNIYEITFAKVLIFS
ncbi:MAG: hypothetical protein LBP72_01235, partial [Dysgonamonadaceae bacterium]|nr:hypothetical protein [Dysgonamonadaceae bacterium]